MEDSKCLSFDFDVESVDNPCRFYDEGSHTHVHEMDGTFWLGAAGLTDAAPSIVDDWESFAIVDIDGVNSVPSDGKINSFKWYGSNPNGVSFYVYRFVSDNIYEVIGTMVSTSTIVGEENFIEVDPPIDVKKGDILGWTWDGAPAFGFDDSTIGQIRYKNGNTGGPTNPGETWEFDQGPVGRRYHMSTSFIPNDAFVPSEPRNYCAAAICQGHCGPVMDAGTTAFAWGVWEGFYTLNWRPSAIMPVGNDCPSGISAVQCWTDPLTSIIWAYGVGGEDCHSTCSLAGVTSADYKCDVNTPITGGFDEVSEIMSHFTNPYNTNDADEFTCDPGGCWNGESSNQIRIHEYNSDCYVPTNDQEYSCTARFGNSNCYGQRFNQVCPCAVGCSWAAGPDCEESQE